ncbi:MAG TPA: DUF2339 domain-containing protein, partial [Puia sp.]|nr:DUF2339 domain-containing protein [Puia sp.]
MEVLVILLFIVLVILIVTFRNRTFERIDRLEKEIRRLREYPETTRPVERTPRPEVRPSPEITEPHVFQASSTGQRDTRQETPPASPVHKPGFFEKHPDLEKFIGENLVSKIGIGILVLAIGFFVKYAIDNDWIGPAGRVGIGVLCGGILIGIAHFLRNSYKAFSSVLVGGGLAVLYFSIALAYHQYQLFSQPVAFVIMLVITAFAVILSLLYDRQELAIIALVGGFVTPFLVSNGSGNYKVLFSYLLILNTGLLVMAYRKAWRLLNLLAFGFTAILFLSWLATLPGNTDGATFEGAFLFATAFYILFFIINIAHNIRENKKFIASDFGILLANTCLYFAAGLYLLTAMGAVKYQGLFSACMAVFNLGISYFLFRKRKVDTNILYLLIGITLTFISLTAPIQLHGHYITLFWASESVLLYWLSRKSGIRLIRWAAYTVWTATLVSLLMDWVSTYYLPFDKHPLSVFFNKGLMTTLYTAACCYLLFRLQKGIAFIIAASLLLFMGGALEIGYQFDHYYTDTHLSTLYLLLYGFTWSYGITYAADRWGWLGDAIYAAALLLFSLLVYLLFIPEVA